MEGRDDGVSAKVGDRCQGALEEIRQWRKSVPHGLWASLTHTVQRMRDAVSTQEYLERCNVRELELDPDWKDERKAADRESEIRSRDAETIRWNREYLEKLYATQLEDVRGVVQRTIALVGWFSLLLAFLALAFTVVGESELLGSEECRWPVWLWGAAVLLFVVSLVSSFRVFLARSDDTDRLRWLYESEYQTPESLEAGRVIELSARIPKIQRSLAIRSSLYNSALTVFSLAILLALSANLLLIGGVIASKSGRHWGPCRPPSVQSSESSGSRLRCNPLGVSPSSHRRELAWDSPSLRHRSCLANREACLREGHLRGRRPSEPLRGARGLATRTRADLQLT